MPWSDLDTFCLCLVHMLVFLLPSQSDRVRVVCSCIWTWTFLLWWLLAAANVAVTLQVELCVPTVYIYIWMLDLTFSQSYINCVHWSQVLMQRFSEVKTSVVHKMCSFNAIFSTKIENKCDYSAVKLSLPCLWWWPHLSCDAVLCLWGDSEQQQ